MKTLKRLLLMALMGLLGTVPGTSCGGQVVVALNEQFNDVNSLTGWTFLNDSNPPGISWFQGNAGIFASHRGAPDAYIAANFLSAQNGSGTIDNWLITPELTLRGATKLSFFGRSAEATGFNDMLEVRFGSGGNFGTLLATLGGSTPWADSWQHFSTSLDVTGSGQFAFRYVGDAAASNYVGLDSLLVTTVPEPSAWLLLAAGTLALLAVRRQRQPRSTL